MIHPRTFDAFAVASMISLLGGVASLRLAEFSAAACGLAVGVSLVASILVGTWLHPSDEELAVALEERELFDESDQGGET